MAGGVDEMKATLIHEQMTIIIHAACVPNCDKVP